MSAQDAASSVPALHAPPELLVREAEQRAVLTLANACRRKDVQAIAAAIAQAKPVLPSLVSGHGHQQHEVNVPLAVTGLDAEHSFLTYVVLEPHPANAQAARLLLGYGARVDAFNGRALKWAAMTGQPEVVKVLLEAGARWDLPSSDGFEALHFAVRSLCARSVRYLLEAGADANSRMLKAKQQPTPLLLLALREEVDEAPAAAAEVVRLLLQHGADLCATFNDNSSNVLHACARRGSPRLARTLLQQARDAATRARLASHADARGFTPLHQAAGGPAMYSGDARDRGVRAEGRFEVAALLLDAGADVNAQAPGQGDTALHLAANDTNWPMMELLLAHGADPLLRHRCGLLTALQPVCAMSPEGWRVVEPLVRVGGQALLSSGGDRVPPLCFAVAHGHLRTVQELLRLGAPVNQRAGPFKLTALYYAGHAMERACGLSGECPGARDALGLRSGPSAADMAADLAAAGGPDVIIQIIHLLLAHGADPNIAYKLGAEAGTVSPATGLYSPKNTLLSGALHCRSVRMAQVLVDAGADPTAERGTCLFGAIFKGQPDVLRVLLSSRLVDVNQTRVSGTTLLHLACIYLQPGCAEVLLEAGAAVRVQGAGGKTRSTQEMVAALKLLRAPDMAVELHPRPPPQEVAQRKRQLLRMLTEADERARTQARTPRGSSTPAPCASRLSSAPAAPASSHSPPAAAAAAAAGVPAPPAAPAAPAPSVKACSHCGVLEGARGAGGGGGAAGGAPVSLKRCTGCGSALYCSEECQRAAWRSGHKEQCAVLAHVQALLLDHAAGTQEVLASRMLASAQLGNLQGGQ